MPDLHCCPTASLLHWKQEAVPLAAPDQCRKLELSERVRVIVALRANAVQIAMCLSQLIETIVSALGTTAGYLCCKEYRALRGILHSGTVALSIATGRSNAAQQTSTYGLLVLPSPHHFLSNIHAVCSFPFQSTTNIVTETSCIPRELRATS